MSVPAAAFAYFAIVFAAGFALGTARVLWLAPWIGPRAAELAEMPVMVVITYLAARGIMRRVVDRRRSRLLAIGLLALAVLAAFDLGVVLLILGLTLREYLTARDPVAGTLYLISLVLFALMPLVVVRMRGARRGPETP